jgi:hypothetical protein
MPELSPLQNAILKTIEEEIKRDLVAGKCELSDAAFIEKVVERNLRAPHKNSIGAAIDALVAKGKIEKVTNSLPGSTGRVRTITLANK